MKQLDAGKLESRAEVGRFMGIDTESKGYRIYWPGKNEVTIKRDVYFNEDEALMPDEVLIEGENDIFTNSNLLQPSNTSQIVPMPVRHVKNTLSTPAPENFKNMTENLSVVPSDVAKTNQSSDANKATQSTRVAAPHQ